MSIFVKDIYEKINQFAPFATQEKWDNSGLLVGDPKQEVSGVLISLDISVNALKKAQESGCNLIFSHHPVIFSAIRNLYADSIVYQLAKHDISAICCHTPLDIAKGGINDLIVQKLEAYISIEDEILPLEDDGLGRIIILKNEISLPEFARIAKNALHCENIRFSANHQGKIKKIAVCSGSGASMLEDLSGRCDCFLTGDVKHDRWYKAEELHIALLDCGHYATEVIMIPYVAGKIHEAFPELKIIEFAEGDPVHYV
ncbi:MAG: Nif3-like dinuclear metal center hexameric protein [Oscillospiraceae bacterium]|nr:Nif3-like dinuclear metal center hexameric protein [Oscillospiraceae bacterium]